MSKYFHTKTFSSLIKASLKNLQTAIHKIQQKTQQEEEEGNPSSHQKKN